ncbi:DUF1090 domain-containing protein [Marinobacter sp. M1N3S26]|uniref:DUF1090 domain-containing protein n=1 Tax=Marinobacter sp. M1N3S26 TaxID=3382299 RepID=UPI00387B9028
MKRHSLSLSALVLALGFGVPAFAASTGNPLCAAKEAEVERQMDMAREQGNRERLRGLETSLERIRTHCTDEGLLADAEEEVRDSLEDLEEQRQELEEAIQEGDTDEIEDRREDLKEATDELEEHTRELEALRNQAGR